MQKHRMAAKILVLCTIAILLAGCNQAPNVPSDENTVPITITDAANNENTSFVSPLDALELTLPDGIVYQRDSMEQASFVKNSSIVGGVFLLECDEAVFGEIRECFGSLKGLVLQKMSDVGISEMDWEMSSSSAFAFQEYSFGTADSEYIAYAVRGNATCYIVWFDCGQVETDVEISIMQSLHSEDITDELNIISTEAVMDAIAASMANKEYYLEVTLPDGFTQSTSNNEGALFYSADQLVGGYKVVHYEQGILPAAQENAELILERLRDYVSDQVDLSDFSAEITSDRLITVIFKNEETEYTHFILSYGQVGTQYDLWLETTSLKQEVVDAIVNNVLLVECSE